MQLKEIYIYGTMLYVSTMGVVKKLKENFGDIRLSEIDDVKMKVVLKEIIEEYKNSEGTLQGEFTDELIKRRLEKGLRDLDDRNF